MISTEGMNLGFVRGSSRLSVVVEAQVGPEIKTTALVVGFEGQAPGTIISQSLLPLRPPSRRQGVIPVADSPLQETERTCGLNALR